MAADTVKDAADKGVAPLVRSLTPADSEALQSLDDDHAAAVGSEGYVNRGSLHYFARSGHSFIAESTAGDALGFVFAHTTWTGGRPALRLERLVASRGTGQEAVATALAEAVVKSAYDAGVYRLSAEVDANDPVGRVAVTRAGFTPLDVVAFGRTLGSLGAGRSGSE